MLLIAVAALLAGHALLLRYALPHKGVSEAVVAGVIALVVIKHLGLLSSLVAMLRRRSRSANEK